MRRFAAIPLLYCSALLVAKSLLAGTACHVAGQSLRWPRDIRASDLHHTVLILLRLLRNPRRRSVTSVQLPRQIVRRLLGLPALFAAFPASLPATRPLCPRLRFLALRRSRDCGDLDQVADLRRCMDTSPIVAHRGLSLSPTSPASSRQGNGGQKRKRSSAVTHESSPASALDEDHGDRGDHGDHDKKRQPGVKRACNECRQQKVSLLFIQSSPRVSFPLRIAWSAFSDTALLEKVDAMAPTTKRALVPILEYRVLTT